MSLAETLPNIMQGKKQGLLKYHPFLAGFSTFTAFLKNAWFPFFVHMDVGCTLNIAVEGSQQWYTFPLQEIDKIKKVSLNFKWVDFKFHHVFFLDGRTTSSETNRLVWMVAFCGGSY